jgi:hypothetical protein
VSVRAVRQTPPKRRACRARNSNGIADGGSCRSASNDAVHATRQPAKEGGRLPEIAGERDNGDLGVLFGKFGELDARLVLASVIHEQKLERDALALQRPLEVIAKRREGGGIIDGNDNAQLCCGLAPASMSEAARPVPSAMGAAHGQPPALYPKRAQAIQRGTATGPPRDIRSA